MDNIPNTEISTREQALRQKYDAMKQLSAINASEPRNTGFVKWFYTCKDIIRRTNELIDVDIASGKFGTRTYLLFQLSLDSESTSTSVSDRDKRCDEIVDMLAKHFPRSSLVVDTETNPASIIYDPNS